jgi:glycerol-3-phosphate dehydrogenase
VSRHLAEVLGWTEDRRQAEVAAYRSRVEAERAAEAQPDDRSADAARRQGRAARGVLPPGEGVVATTPHPP